MQMFKSNFESAMLLAVQAAKKNDQQRGITESAFTAGLIEILNASLKGEQITIEDK